MTDKERINTAILLLLQSNGNVIEKPIKKLSFRQLAVIEVKKARLDYWSKKNLC